MLCIDTFSSIFSNNGEGGRSVHRAVTQTGAVRRHMTTVDGINVELEWTSCNRENRRGILRTGQFDTAQRGFRTVSVSS